MALIAIVGMTGSGKSVVTEVFEENGYKKIRFGQITIDILKDKNLEINEQNERKVREDIRNEHGMAAYAILNLPKIKELLSRHDKIVLDGLYSWEEYKVLKKEFPDYIILAVYTSPKTRYERLKKRKIRPLTKEEALSRDHSEIENLHKAGPIAIADYTIDNNGTIEQLKNKIFSLIQKL